MKNNNDPDGQRLPVKIDSTSNGEFVPQPISKVNLEGNRLAQDWATTHAKRTALKRRDFLTSTCGFASTLLAMNTVNAAAGKIGGSFAIEKDAAMDRQLADHTFANREFIFDIQGHHAGALHTWREDKERFRKKFAFTFMPQSNCNYRDPNPQWGHMRCFTGDAFIKEVFLDSDTHLAVLSMPPTTEEKMSLRYSEAALTRDTVDAMAGTNRLMMHGRVIPNLPGDMEKMAEVVERWKISAWKTYTQYGPDHSSGWWFDDPLGETFLENVRQSGVKLVCVHKGLPLPFPAMGKKNLEYRLCRDIGPAAKANPDITFIVYHSGYDLTMQEGPYTRGKPIGGIDYLVDSLLDHGIKPNSNVYAELGSTWRELMKDPDQAAHSIGKLLKYVGEDRLVWGTDSIWYGSPQDQINAFRTFQISKEYQEKYGYPEITPEIRAKVFGLNAAEPYGISVEEIKRVTQKDDLALTKEHYQEQADPSYLTYGPRTRREFLNFVRQEEKLG